MRNFKKLHIHKMWLIFQFQYKFEMSIFDVEKILRKLILFYF